jgi:hypothetical protein
MSDKRPTITITGDVNAANVNMGEQTFHGPVSFSMGALPAAPASTRAELEALYRRLADALAQVPAEQQEEAAAVEQLAQTALDEADKANPNKTLLTVTAEGLKQAAQNLAAVAPIAVEIAKTLTMIG